MHELQNATHEDTRGPGPLSGIKVLDVSTVYAAPITAMLLGDMGADVLKVEHPKGDPARTHGWNREGHGLWWKVIARNKRAVTLNLGHPEGQELLRELAADADVIVENFRPGVMEKWGLGPDTLLDINPRLVMLRVTGFGQDGPYKERRAFGTLMEAMSGFAHQTGQEDGPPTLPPFGLADGVAGIAGAYAVLTALYHRDLRGATGAGQVIDLALLEPLLGILGPGPTVYDQLGIIAGRHGNRSPNNAPRNAYVTRDGRWVAISASATSIAERVMRLVGRGDLVDKPWFSSAGERSRRAEVLDGAVQKWISARDLSEVLEAFEDAGAAIAPIYDVEQLVNDPHVHRPRHDHHRRRRGPRPAEDAEPDLPARRHPGRDPLDGPAARAGQRGGVRLARHRGRAAGGAAGEGSRLDGPELPVRARAQRQAARPGVHRRRGRADARPGGRRAACFQGGRAPDGGRGAGRSACAGPGLGAGQHRAHRPCAADLDAVAEHAYGIRIPKTESPDDVAWVAARAPGKPIICAIESARGVLAAQEIAAAPGVRHLAMGGVDLQRDLNTTGGNAQTLYVRSHLVICSRAAGIEPPIDSVFPRLSDDAELRSQAEFARSLGFFGKSAIHPRQLPVLHDVFTPSERELAWAHEVLAAFDAAGGAALRLPDGEFVDLPVAQRARRVLQLAEAVPRVPAGV